jgi:hypothetical protein
MKTHVKWITWVGVVLMLIAMAVYVITLDESEPLPMPGAEKNEQAQ